MQDENYSDVREKFIAAQSNPPETQKLAISLREDVEKLGIKTTIDIPKERVEAYTTVGGVPHLDGEYTVFGRIVEGLDVIDKIASVKTGQADKPVEDISMTFKVDKIKKEEITKRYGYTYPE